MEKVEVIKVEGDYLDRKQGEGRVLSIRTGLGMALNRNLRASATPD